MSEFDDYTNDMTKSRLSDREIEQLLTGRSLDKEALQPLAVLVEDLRGMGNGSLTEATTRRYAAEAAEAARAAHLLRSRPGAEKVLPRPGTTMLRLTAKTATVVAAAFLAVGIAGMAWAANRSNPGDGLYGVDLALEQVGILAGGASERLAEASALVRNGRASDALSHAAQAVAQVEPVEDHQIARSEASAALEAAATRVAQVDGSEHLLQVSENVAALLEYIKANVRPGVGDDGREFGQGVAALARQIAGKAGVHIPDLSDIPPVDLSDQGDFEDGLSDTPGGPPFSVPVGRP